MSDLASVQLQGVKRVGIVFGHLDAPALPALQYMVLHLNTLQSDIEFEFPPVEPDDEFLVTLRRGAIIDVDTVTAGMPRFIERTHAELAKYASERLVGYAPPARIAVISLATTDQNWYEIATDRYSAIFLGDWEREMAPPSLLEFILSLLIAEGLITLLWPVARSLSHLNTRGCIGDFNSTLADVRYKTFQGFFCADCRRFIEARLGPEAAAHWAKILEKGWLGSTSDESSPAAVVAKLGYDLFVTKGLAPTRWERLSAILTEDGTKEVLKLVAAIALALLLLKLGLKK